MKEKTYTQVHLDKDAYTRELDVPKARMRIHALSRKEKRIHVGELMFGPWYLVRSVDPKYWVHGIDLLWFWIVVL